MMGEKTFMTPLTDEQKEQSNVLGTLGPICNTCGGLGWTNMLGGGTKNCADCEKTGIATMSRRELQEEVLKLRQMIGEIVKNLMAEGIVGIKTRKGKNV